MKFIRLQEITRKKSLATTLVLAGACTLFGSVLAKPPLFLFAAGFVITGFFIRPAAAVITLLWLNLAVILGAVNARIILGLSFYLCLTPLAFFYRLFNANALNIRRAKRATLWDDRNHAYEPKDMDKMW